MGNKERNRQFLKACKKLGITDKSLERRFHEYLNSPMYENVSDEFSYGELFKVGKEFLEYTGVQKKRKTRKQKV